MSDDAPMILTVFYYPHERSARVDVGSVPAPLAAKLFNLAADQCDDLCPIDSITLITSTAEFETPLVWTDEEQGE